MSAEQQAGVKRRSSRAAREGKRRRRTAARTTAAPTVQEATQAAIAAGSDEQQQEAPVSRAEARRLAKAQAASSRGRGRGFVSSERTEGLRRFIRETMAEIRKVVWPDRETTRNLTLLVIALAIVMGILLGSIDFVLFEVFEAF